MKKSVFRKASIERLASPEQLDQLMQVTTPKGWIALGAVCLLLAGAVVWGIYGRIPTNVRAMGVLIKSGGVYDIVPRSSGQITDIAVNAGHAVQAGQVIARIDQPMLIDEIQRVKQNLAEIRGRHLQLVHYGSLDAQLQNEMAAQQAIDLKQSIRSTEEQISWFEEKITSQTKLLDDGLITRQSLLTSRQQRQAAGERIEQLRLDLKQLEIRRLANENRRNQEILASRQQIAELENEVERLEGRHMLASEVRSPYTGRILEVMAEPGGIVVQGNPIMRLDLVGDHIEDLEAVLYVPSTDGKRVREGMAVQISPTIVKREEHGYMQGTVSRVSDYPATAEAMARVLKNKQLVHVLSGGGAPYETYASLKLDSSTPSGFRWSSSHGPDTRIQSGTICSATITVDERRPAEMVLPVLRRFLGV